MTKNKYMTIKKATLIVFALWCLLQLVILVVYFNHELVPDSAKYISDALQSLTTGTPYPSQKNLYDTYIFAPGFVAYLTIIIRLFGTYKAAMIINLLMNIGIVWGVYYITRRFFDKSTALISVILYCLLFSNLFVPLHIITEVPYLFLCLLGFIFTLQDKPAYLIAGGVAYALAYTMRPLVLAFLIASLVYLFIHKRKLVYYFCLLFVYGLLLFAYSQYNKSNCGYGIVSSTTGGYNLIMTANDGATTIANFSIYQQPGQPGYIPNAACVPFAVKDSIWKARSVVWIRHHPVRYASLVAKRVPRLYSADCWPLSSVFAINTMSNALQSANQTKALRERRIVQGIESITYYLVMLFFLLALYEERRNIFSDKGTILLIVLLGTGGTCLFPVELRYHYPYLFAITIWAAAWVSAKMRERSSSHSR
jgi:preprotein translocase subunit SecG